MSSLRLATASNVRAFQDLLNALQTNDSKWANSIDCEALEDEIGRFRVWSGNLGALLKGHGSLDYRLRDSPLLSSNALKFLGELEENLKEALAVVSGARLPYEEQPKPEKTEEDEDDDSFFSEDEDDDEDKPNGTRTELSMRVLEVVDIIDNMYKLSVRIRTPTIRSRSLKAASYKPKDPDTGVDILSMYAEYDLQHMKELLSHLRQPHLASEQNADDFIVARLSAAITLRRRQFKYWKRHRDKLGASTMFEETLKPVQPIISRPEGPQRYDTIEVHPGTPINLTVVQAPSQKTSKTLLSGTEATHHHQPLDEIVDTKSVTSYAVTVKDIHGKGVDLPPPPKAADGGKDFECPYCYIICPARYGRGRAWRTHLLQDLQPYICTYSECESAEQLFRSRREWVEHEASHRKAWRCPEHPTAIYKTPAGLEEHFRWKHMDGTFPESQLAIIVKVGETSTLDLRQKCPICYVTADSEGLGDFQNHIANHLERIAAFALPNATEDDSDGASSAASRGWTGSQDMSEMSLPSDATEGQEPNQVTNTQHDVHPLNLAADVGPTRALLSAESLKQLPDASQNRLDMVANQFGAQGSSDDLLPDDEDDFESHLEDEQVDEIPAELQEHLEQREEFRAYLVSLPGSESVRFYKRYGSWTGQATFKDAAAAAQAVEKFNTRRFPSVRIYQSSQTGNKVKFAASNPLIFMDNKLLPSRHSTLDTQEEQDTRDASSASIVYDGEKTKNHKKPILNVSEIPTLRSLYRSRRLMQRDQSYAPNDVYNRTISFCYYDLTRLKVDVIVNSANGALKTTEAPDTLNNIIHKAAGPGLAQETKSKGKVKAGQAELTKGYNLPSAWVIHAARPQYFGSKGMGQFNVLTECYRSALRMATNYELKNIAFPCLGTGGCGFPPRVAARIALQEVREYLDAHSDETFERIVFCVNSARDEKAYMDFFPVFFPPTHGDLEVAKSSEWSANRAALAGLVLETRTEVQKLLDELSTDFSLLVPEFDGNILSELSAIDSVLASIRAFLLGPRVLKRSLGDLTLICSVMQTVCSSVTEIIEQAKDTGGAAPRHKSIWDDYNAHMKTMYGTDFAHFLMNCQNFVQCLDDILTQDGFELDEMSAMRQRLEDYKAKQTGQDVKGFRDHLDEVLYTTEFQRETASHTREAISHTREAVRLHQISSVSRLYQLGELEAKPTLAHPSAIFNHMICLVREDITRLEVDIIVNSTDVSFYGMGTLDRTVFERGGLELREQVKKFGTSREGDVKLTPGYLLPAKHILHVVPPEQYRKNTKAVLQQIYREILHTAVLMRATSIAIPSIGTGMLNYPRRDCASLALEEVKRFLESAEPGSLLEKIIFVVYSSNDEFIYRSLLPVYFPPKEYGTQAVPAVQSEPKVEEPPGESSPTPRRTLFGSIGEAVRSIGSSSKSTRLNRTSRQINAYEEHALLGFELHAKDCNICKDITRLYLEGLNLCEKGYPLAQVLLWYMNMSENQSVYSKPDNTGQRVKLELPTDMFPLSLSLLITVEKSYRDKSRSTPFVSQNRSYAATVQDQVQEGDASAASTLHEAEVNESVSFSFSESEQKPQAEVATWSNLAQRWDPIFTGYCSIHIHPGKVEIRESDNPNAAQVPLLALRLTPSTVVRRRAVDTEVIISGAPRLQSVLKTRGDVLFRSQGAVRSVALLDMLQRAIGDAPDHPEASVQTVQELELESAAEPSTSGLPSIESHQSAEVEPQWNQALLDVHGGGASEQRGGRLGSLQSKLQTLREAIGTLRPSSSKKESVPNQPVEEEEAPITLPAVPAHDPAASLQKTSSDGNSSPLADQIIVHLTTDLKSRPSSYIGQHTKDIASALQKDQLEISAAIEELAAQGRVHNTVNGSTWVISRPPAELPVLLQQQNPPEPLRVPATSETEHPLSHLAEQILSYMTYVSSAPEKDSGQTIRELASALQLRTAEIWPVIRELSARGDIKQSSNAERWIVATMPQDAASEAQESSRVREGVAERGASQDNGGDKDRRRGRGSREVRGGWRDGRGEKDRKQAKLNRVLAGDIREEELRHFAEEDDERV